MISVRIGGIELYGLVVVRDGSFVVAALCIRVAAVVERLDVAGVELQRPRVVFYSERVLPDLIARERHQGATRIKIASTRKGTLVRTFRRAKPRLLYAVGFAGLNASACSAVRETR
jgi:hypothetical protein